MDEYYNVVRLLKNAGLNVRGADDTFIYIEDPSCILRAFDSFLNYAWLALGIVTAGLIIGWGISMIRGAKNALTENFKTLILIFGILTAMWPILNVIYGGNIIGAMCKDTKVSIANVNEILAAKPQNANSNSELYEDIDIYDSGPIYRYASETDDYSSLDRFIAEFDDEEIVTQIPVSTGAPSTITETSNIPSGRKTVSAYVNPNNSNEVIYTRLDGTRYSRINGDPPWRYNNPGALMYGDFTKSMGAKAKASNGLAIFPDFETGRNAVLKLLTGARYRNRTIAQAMAVYSPFGHGNNNPISYAMHLGRAVGVPVNTYLRDLTNAQWQRMVLEIYRIEGNRAGTEKDIK